MQSSENAEYTGLTMFYFLEEKIRLVYILDTEL